MNPTHTAPAAPAACPTAGACPVSATTHWRIAAQRVAEDKCEGCAAPLPAAAPAAPARPDAATVAADHAGAGHDVRAMTDTAHRGAGRTYLYCRPCGVSSTTAPADVTAAASHTRRLDADDPAPADLLDGWADDITTA